MHTNKQKCISQSSSQSSTSISSSSMTMRPSFADAPCRKNNHLHLAVLLAAFGLILFFVVPLSRHSFSDPFQHMFPSCNPSPITPPSVDKTALESSRDGAQEGRCDHWGGQWVPDLEGPRYSNHTCWMIEERENCLKHGRPDTDYMMWMWKPAGCEMKRFDAARFFEIVRGKTMAFVGDSLSRNHMQSLMCLLSKVAYPKVIPYLDNDDYKHMYYKEYNFTLWLFWSPVLVRGHQPDSESKYWRLYLDEVDTRWADQIPTFDYIVLSDGNWFTKTSLLYENGVVVGCNGCVEPDIRDLSLLYSNRKAFRTAFSAILNTSGFKGTTFLRTMSPDHFENGDWDTGGYCAMTRPYAKNETNLSWLEKELYHIQLEEFQEAQRKARSKEMEFKLLDITQAMFLRPDGHPNAYGHWPGSNVSKRNDCVHWCMPGPVDLWSDLLFQLMSM